MMSQTFDDVTNNLKIDDIACNISIDDVTNNEFAEQRTVIGTALLSSC